MSNPAKSKPADWAVRRALRRTRNQRQLLRALEYRKLMGLARHIESTEKPPKETVRPFSKAPNGTGSSSTVDPMAVGKMTLKALGAAIPEAKGIFAGIENLLEVVTKVTK